MAGYAILRMEKRSASHVGGLVAHINGDHRPESAEAREGWRPVVKITKGVHGIERCRQVLAEARKRPGRRPQEFTEFLLAVDVAPGEGGWGKQRTTEWMNSGVSFLGRRYKHSLVVCAACHTDENRIHLHVLMLMRDSTGRLGQAGALSEAVGQKYRRRTRVEHNQLCSLLQDAYHAEVGVQFDLARGERGSDRKNEKVDPVRAERLRVIRSHSTTLAEKLEAALALNRDLEKRIKALDRARRSKSQRADERVKAAERRLQIALEAVIGRKLRNEELQEIRQNPHRAKEIVTGAPTKGPVEVSGGDEAYRNASRDSGPTSARRDSKGGGNRTPSR